MDFRTLGDNQLGRQKLDYPWQSPATVAHSWGFHSLDTHWKSTTTLLKSLINNVSLNGNFMLNIGPRANGDVPFEISQRMLAMGDWLAVNGEAIYGTQGFDLRQDLHDWGNITCQLNDKENTLFLHVFTWPFNKQLTLTGVNTKPSKVYVLADKQKTSLPFEFNDMVTRISLPPAEPDPYVSVVVVEYEKKPQVITGLVAQTVDGGYALKPNNQNPPAQLEVQRKSRRGTIPEHVIVDKPETFTWDIYINEPHAAIMDMSYSFQHESNNSTATITVNDQTLEHNLTPTGKTVGEPKADWVIDNFKANRVGSIEFVESGFYTIELEIDPGRDEVVQFQWLWLK